MAKKLIAFSLVLVLLISQVYAAGAGTGSSVYSSGMELVEGFSYENEISYTSSGYRVETHTLISSANSSVYPIVLANDTIYGGMTVTEVIAYAESLGYNVVAAINSDFGYWSTKIPCGMVVEDGIYKSSPEQNNALAYLADGTAFTSFMPEVIMTIVNETQDISLWTDHLNKTRDDDNYYLYSEYFSTVSTRTTNDGTMVRLEYVEEDADITLGGELKLVVTDIYKGTDAQEIGEDYLILTATVASGLSLILDEFQIGDEVTLTVKCSDERLEEAVWVTGGGNILLDEGEIFHSEWWDSSVTGLNPRTAVGIMEDGTIIYHVIDGRSDLSYGATMQMLADDLKSMGCVYAINMDGGGSSIMSLKMPSTDTQIIMNVPSDGYQRSVCTYILFVTDEVSTGTAENFFIDENGIYVMTGAELELDIHATDSSMSTAKLPTDLVVKASLGTYYNGIYKAGTTVGVDTISLSSQSVGASSTASIYIVDTVDSITVTESNSDTAIKSKTMENGEELALYVSATLNSRAVTLAENSVTYEVIGDIGEIDEDGVFTASGEPNANGSIKVSVGGKSYEIEISIKFEFSDMKDHWAEEFVSELFDLGIVTGMSDTEFMPENGLKRGDFILMLYRAAGEPDVVFGEDAFTDVSTDMYYAKAIEWARQVGIATGTGDGKFSAEDGLTREQGMTFMYRALDDLDISYDATVAEIPESYTDVSEVSSWAVEAVAKLMEMGIVEGSDNKINPSGTLTRAQMAKMICVSLL